MDIRIPVWLYQILGFSLKQSESAWSLGIEIGAVQSLHAAIKRSFVESVFELVDVIQVLTVSLSLVAVSTGV